MWGALLAGGDVVVSKGTSDKYLTEEDEIYCMAAMSGWLYIDTRKNNTNILKVCDERNQFVIAEQNSDINKHTIQY